MHDFAYENDIYLAIIHIYPGHLPICSTISAIPYGSHRAKVDVFMFLFPYLINEVHTNPL